MGAVVQAWWDVVGSVVDQVAGAPLPLLVLGVVVVMAMDTTTGLGVLVPSSDAIVATVAAAVGVRTAPAVALATVVGCLVGWSVSYTLGRRFGPGLRTGALGRLVGAERWDAAARALDGRPGRALLVLQFLPVANAVIPAVAGALGMPYRRFVRLAAAGITLWATVFAALGAVAGTVVRPGTLALVIVTATVLLAGAATARTAFRGAARPAAAS